MGKGSKKQTIGYKYYLGMHNIFCQGPIDAVTRATVDDRQAWVGSTTGGQIIVNAPDIFGGESREGGVSGLIDIEMGGPTQGQNSYLLSKLGALIPAYRGVVGAVFRQCYLGNNPYLKAWRFRGQRVFLRQNGIDQWYLEKASIPSISDVKYLGFYLIWQMRGHTPDGDGGYFVDSITPSATQSIVFSSGDGQTYSVPLRVQGHTELRSYTGSTPVAGRVVKGGVPGATSGYNIYKVEVSNPPAVYYLNSGVSALGVVDINEVFTAPITDGATVTFTASSDDGRMIGTYQYLGVSIDGIPLDLNAVHIIRECLTDPDWGMGYTDDDVDSVSFEYAADMIHSEGLGMSLLWDKQIKLEEFVDEVKKHIDAAVYVSRNTGKFVIKLIRNDYNPDDLLLLDESNIARVEDPSRSSFGELINSVTVNYWDVATGKDASLTITDTAMVQTQGAVINTTLQYPGFTNARNATVAGQRDLKTLSTPGLTCTIYADSDAKDLNIGDAFKFSWAKWGLVEVIMRVANISYGTGRNNQVRIECTQDSYDTNTTVVISVPNNEWENPSSPPGASDDQLAQEAPYFEIVQALGEADTDNKLLTHPEIGYIVAAVSRAPSAINARLWSDTGSGYEQVSNLDFSPTANLTTAITKTQTAFTVDNMEDLAEVILGTHVQVGDELMRVDTIDTVTGAMTVGRGVLDTVPQEHASGDMLFFWDFYAGFDPTEYTEGEEVDVKITPVSGSGVFPLDEAIPMTVTLAQRANRPYAPGDLRINGDSYLDNDYLDELTITWAHRDRLQQTGGVLIDHTAGDIGPEPGTLYRVRGYIDGILVHTEDDIAGVSANWTPLDGGLVSIEIHSKRDSLYSMQAPSHSFYYTGGADVITTMDSEPRYTEEGASRVTED